MQKTEKDARKKSAWEFYLKVIFSGLVSTLNGPACAAHAMVYSIPFLGPLHVAEHVPPQPYWNAPCATTSPSLFVTL
jgi:hypothetical protein